MKRWLLLAMVGLIGSAVWAQEPGHYTLDLDGWDANQFFDFMPNPTNLNTGDFSNPGVFCGDNAFCGDPGFKLNNGGGSTPESGSYTFNSGTGTETLDIQNTGASIDEVVITLTDADGNPIPLPEDELNDVFTCSSDIFQDCGFSNDAFQIAFWNPINSDGIGIPTAVPEPSQMAALLLACAAVIVLRGRKGSASSASVPTAR